VYHRAFREKEGGLTTGANDRKVILNAKHFFLLVKELGLYNYTTNTKKRRGLSTPHFANSLT